MVYEYVRTLVLLYETITFSLIEPFDNSIGHFGTFLPLEFSRFQTSGCQRDKWFFPSERNRTASNGAAL
jgi:hypothetical protein